MTAESVTSPVPPQPAPVPVPPAPEPTPMTAPFWAGTAQGELRIQWCPDCRRHSFPPRPHCPVCAGPLEWVVSSGRGIVATFAINHRPDRSFGSGEPQILAVVELEEGVRMATNLVGIEPDPEAIEIGMPVAVRYLPRGDVRLPVFAPRGSS